MDALTFPNVRAIAIPYLAAVLDDVTVVATLPDGEVFDELLPIVRVSRVGGVSSHSGWSHGPVFDHPTLDIDIYYRLGSVEAEANLDALVERVRKALAAMKGHLDRNAGGVVTRCSEIAGPAPRPETNTTVIRVGFTVGLTVRPL